MHFVNNCSRYIYIYSKILELMEIILRKTEEQVISQHRRKALADFMGA